ncbi:MAG: sporulation protein YqfD [Lachnospiraceae bacterium]|nr:sporulation protein YqfD [Lachnospiraceae bacterium]
MKQLFDFLGGLVFVEFRGTSPERFFNVCRSRNIPLYDICTHVTEQGTVTVAKMKLRDYRKVRSVAKKSHCIPYIKKRIGLPFLLKKYRKRVVFFAGGVYFLWLMWLLSRFVWDISVTGGFVHTEEEMLSYLQENNIVCGMRREDIDCAEIERQLRIDYPDIGWVSAELKGTKLFLRLAETDMPSMQEETEGPVHLVATSDGIVERIVCRNGTPLVREGDVVRKGDILVSGVISVVGDNDTLVNRYAVTADADIFLKTVKQYEHSFSRIIEEKEFTGEEKTGYVISFGNQKIFSHMPSHSYTNYAIIAEDTVLSLHEHFPLPFRIQKTVTSEYVPREREYTEEEANALAAQALERYVAYLTEHETTVLSTDVVTTVDKRTVQTKGKLILLSAAWERQAVQEDEWRMQEADEYRGIDDGTADGAQ